MKNTINKHFVLNTLKNNLGFPIINDDVVGEVIKMSAREAFLYAVLTSHGYLDVHEPENRFFLKRDYFRVFNQAEEFNLQEGIFSITDTTFSCTPKINIKEKQYITEEYKYILPVEYDFYDNFLESLTKLDSRLKESGSNPNNYIIVPIRRGSKVSQFESFFEYIISSIFSRKGYFTDTQVPFYYAVGTPDAAAYDIEELRLALIKHGLGYRGFSLIELMMITSFGLDNFKGSISKLNSENLVFEVKTLQRSAPQIKKYISTGIFNKAYEVIPFKDTSEAYTGVISFNSNGDISVIEDNAQQEINPNKQKSYMEWLNIYVKCYLLANLTTSELEALSRKWSFQLTPIGIVEFLKQVEFETLLSQIINNVEN